MARSVHKLVFAATPSELNQLLQEEARAGWHPSKFAPQPVRDGLLIVMEKKAIEEHQHARAS